MVRPNGRFNYALDQSIYRLLPAKDYKHKCGKFRIFFVQKSRDSPGEQRSTAFPAGTWTNLSLKMNRKVSSFSRIACGKIDRFFRIGDFLAGKSSSGKFPRFHLDQLACKGLGSRLVFVLQNNFPIIVRLKFGTNFFGLLECAFFVNKAFVKRRFCRFFHIEEEARPEMKFLCASGRFYWRTFSSTPAKISTLRDLQVPQLKFSKPRPASWIENRIKNNLKFKTTDSLEETSKLLTQNSSD